MRVYTVHIPANATPGDPAAFDRALLVRDGFAFFAFLFTALWFFAHRLWLAGFAVLVAIIAFALLVGQLNLTPLAGIAAQLLFSSLIGLEAGSLRRWTYVRRGMPVVDIVTGIDYEEAETKAAARWLARSRGAHGQGMRAQPGQPGAPAPSPGRDGGVIGLFPEHSR